jgi:signal peptide peptidase SppA
MTMDKHELLALALPDGMWAGTPQALHSLVARYAAAYERPMPEAYVTSSTTGQKQEEPPPYLFGKQGNIGIIEIKGPMTNATHWYDAYDKAATYPAIREALLYAIQDPEVETILLDIESGGGAVSGMFDTGRLIRAINDNVMPVVAFGESIYSAAYCVGSAAGQILTTKSGGIGSIGIIATHMDQSKMYADMGITATVMRAGKYKALANRFEPLTDAARAQMQEGLDAAYGVFVQHVADMRGTTYPLADTKMAQGREFHGVAAKDAGLVDGLTTYDALVAALQESVDKQHPI